MFRGLVFILQLFLAVKLLQCYTIEKRGPESSTPPQMLFRNYAGRSSQNSLQNENLKDAGDALFLTPLIEQGKFKEARNRSRVDLKGTDVHSFSGYLTVQKEKHSNMFFWFFPAQNKAETAPLVIWLQGGPGGSSLFGLFSENGPFSVTKDLQLVERNTSWHLDHNLLYFDNPVGTGFSFTDKDGYCRDETCVGDGLYSALQQFLEVFAELRDAPLYITGESYAGKYVPAFAYTVHKRNPTAIKKINLKGVAIGDGLCDPRSMTDYGSMLYNVGLIDRRGKAQFEKMQKRIVELIDAEQWEAAFKEFDAILNGDMIKTGSLFTNLTGLTNYYNYELDGMPEDLGYYNDFVQSVDVRRAIHVGDKTYNDGVSVEKNLAGDVMKSIRSWIEELLEAGSYKVVIYNGQADIIIAYSLTRSFIDAIKWSGANDFRNADRNIWKVDGAVAGYIKSSNNLVEILVRNAGHLVPYDQPDRALDLIRRVTGINPNGFSDLQ